MAEAVPPQEGEAIAAGDEDQNVCIMWLVCTCITVSAGVHRFLDIPIQNMYLLVLQPGFVVDHVAQIVKQVCSVLCGAAGVALR